MITSLARLIDWLAIQLVWAPAAIQLKLKRSPGAVAPSVPLDETFRLPEALEFLRGTDFIPLESQPARIEITPGRGSLSFCFRTPRPGEVEENNIVYGRIYPGTGSWQQRPSIILMPGAPGS